MAGAEASRALRRLQCAPRSGWCGQVSGASPSAIASARAGVVGIASLSDPASVRCPWEYQSLKLGSALGPSPFLLNTAPHTLTSLMAACTYCALNPGYAMPLRSGNSQHSPACCGFAVTHFPQNHSFARLCGLLLAHDSKWPRGIRVMDSATRLHLHTKPWLLFLLLCSTWLPRSPCSMRDLCAIIPLPPVRGTVPLSPQPQGVVWPFLGHLP